MVECKEVDGFPKDMPYAIKRKLAWDIEMYGNCFYEKKGDDYFRIDPLKVDAKNIEDEVKKRIAKKVIKKVESLKVLE